MQQHSLDASPLGNCLRTAVLSLNLGLCIFLVPLSAFTIVCLVRTSVLHPNLKFVLLTQSGAFIAFACCNIKQSCVVLVLGPDHSLDGKVVYFVSVLCYVFITLIGHVLIIERAIATIWASKYEHWTKPHFCFIWFTAICTYGAIVAYEQVAQQDQNRVLQISDGMMLYTYVVVSMSLLEIFIFLLLGTYNRKNYKQWMRGSHSNSHNLSERYQLAENVRTARQLGPSVVLHFVNFLLSSSLVTLLYHKVVVNPTLINMHTTVCLLYLTFSNSLIEYTIVSCHPILRRDALHLVCSLRSKLFGPSANRVTSVQPTSMVLGIGQSVVQMEHNQKTTQDHFRQLKAVWHYRPPKK